MRKETIEFVRNILMSLKHRYIHQHNNQSDKFRLKVKKYCSQSKNLLEIENIQIKIQIDNKSHNNFQGSETQESITKKQRKKKKNLAEGSMTEINKSLD